MLPRRASVHDVPSTEVSIASWLGTFHAYGPRLYSIEPTGVLRPRSIVTSCLSSESRHSHRLRSSSSETRATVALEQGERTAAMAMDWPRFGADGGCCRGKR